MRSGNQVITTAVHSLKNLIIAQKQATMVQDGCLPGDLLKSGKIRLVKPH